MTPIDDLPSGAPDVDQTGAREATDGDRSARRRGTALVVTFTAATFASATLLFLVQPMVAKMLLPQLGGSAAVWNTASVFFQAVLLGGYAFSHVTLRQLGVRRQPILQVAVVLTGLAVLPIAVPGGWQAPTEGSPSLWTLAVLVVMVGLPFFVLSTVSPTLQRWFSTTDHPRADDPYFLYAAGNVGSLLALVGYPLVLEPRFSLGDQSRAWAVGYGVFAVLLAASAVAARRHRAVAPAVGPSQPAATTSIAADEAPAIDGRTRLRWIGLAAVPSALMLGVTRHISSEVAAMPLLWVAPLALYLGTFVVAFGKHPDRAVAISSRALKLLVVPLALSFYAILSSLVVGISLHLAVFAAATMVAHGRLAQERPAPSRLTEFYLLMSVGGVVGGAVAALLAPLVFNTVLEYPIALVAALALLPRSAFEPSAASRARSALVVGLAVAGAGAAVAIRSDGSQRGLVLAIAVAGMAAALAYLLARTPGTFAAALAVVIGVAALVPANATAYEARTFYGVHRVYVDEANDGRRVLLNGSTVHGMELTEGPTAGQPTTYYHPSGPIGRWFAAHEGRGPRRIDVVGLGTGALAWYGRAGDDLRFYEIDDAVVHIAEDPDLFTFLTRSKADLDVGVGDGRLLLERAEGRADAIVVDAFSGDSIPAHLMTDEAIELYLDRVTDDGAIVFHISNRFFDFSPVLARLAEEHGLVARLAHTEPTAEAADQGALATTWVVLARTDADTGVADLPGWSLLDDGGDAPLWTDDRSDLLTLLD